MNLTDNQVLSRLQSMIKQRSNLIAAYEEHMQLFEHSPTEWKENKKRLKNLQINQKALKIAFRDLKDLYAQEHKDYLSVINNPDFMCEV